MQKLGTYKRDGWSITIAKKVSIARHEETGEVVIASAGEDISDTIKRYVSRNPDLFKNNA